jgi:[acyl-carrier-protein] S-malonyltransferase
MSLALLFPGQGTQHAAMLPWLGQDGPALQRLQDRLGNDWRERSKDIAWATGNAVAQSLITGLSLAAWEQLQALLPLPAVVAGYSVGELAAFSVAGVFSASVAQGLAGLRAHTMDGCVQGQATGLLSVSGAAPGLVDQLCARYDLGVAICLAPDRLVLGGQAQALVAAGIAATAAGATATRLAVAIASHTACLKPGVPVLAAALESIAFARPTAALVRNYSATALRRPADLRQALAGQMAHTVRWDRCMQAVAERCPTCVLEVGPGTTLSRMWNARCPHIPARSLDDFQQAAAVATWVAQTLAGR